jgi:hypothetical protein
MKIYFVVTRDTSFTGPDSVIYVTTNKTKALEHMLPCRYLKEFDVETDQFADKSNDLRP